MKKKESSISKKDAELNRLYTEFQEKCRIKREKNQLKRLGYDDEEIEYISKIRG